ncbi:MAG: helix-turn-helix domain-containing protein [Pseudomonadota bacterium]
MTAFLLVVPSTARLANALLALFLFATAVDVSGWFIRGALAQQTHLEEFRPVLAMLQMPAFAGFVWLNCFHRRVAKAYDALHGLPAVIVLGFIITDTAMPGLRAAFEAQYVAYIAAAIYALWQVRSKITNRSSWQSSNWLWLVALVAMSLVAHSLFVFRTVFFSDISEELSRALETGAALLVLVIMVTIAFQALLNPQIFRGLDRIMAFAAKEFKRPAGGDTESLGNFMVEQRPYLDPELSVSRLARQSGVTAKDLSAEINDRYGVHFFDFVNRYRVEHAKALLAETDQSVTEIFLGSGFNTKSSFNAAFRKHSGTTPTSYRRELKKP